MTTRAHEGKADLIIASVVLLVAIAISVFRHEPMPPKLSPPPADLIAFQPGPSPQPVVVLSADQRELTVTAHARRDLLVCMRQQCRLVEEWVGK
jgi:hypothetical protein